MLPLLVIISAVTVPTSTYAVNVDAINSVALI